MPSRVRATRRVLVVSALALGAMLVVLVAVLAAQYRDAGSAREYPPAAGIRALHVLLGPGAGSKPLFDEPMGAAFGNDGRVYVADTGNNRIVVFDREGRYLFEFGQLGIGKPAPGGTSSWKPGRFNYPTDVACDDEGNVYVADFRNDQIQVFDSEGRFLRVFPDRTKPLGKGASGQGGHGVAVTSIAVDDGRVYATDRYQVVVFSTDGVLLGQFGKPGSGPADLDHPNGIAVGPNSLLVVSDSNHNRVLGMTLSGELLWSVGQPSGDVIAEKGGEFEVPRGLTAAAGGSVIVADAMASRLVRVTSEGTVDRNFGQRGDAPGELNFPTDVDSLGERLVIAEKGGNRVQIFVLEGD